MARNREKNRAQVKEERLNGKTEWNTSDPTPRQAVDNIIEEEKNSK